MLQLVYIYCKCMPWPLVIKNNYRQSTDCVSTVQSCIQLCCVTASQTVPLWLVAESETGYVVRAPTNQNPGYNYRLFSLLIILFDYYFLLFYWFIVYFIKYLITMKNPKSLNKLPIISPKPKDIKCTDKPRKVTQPHNFI